MTDSIKLSERSEAMPSSPIRRLVPYAQAAIKKGKTVYHLNIGQPDVQTPNEIMDAVRSFDEKVLEYGTSKGNESLRKSMTRYYSTLGLSIDPEEISITQGASEAAVFVYSVLMDPGDEVILFEPFYANYNGFSSMLGIKTKPITLKGSEDFALPSKEVILEHISERTKAIQICTPNNPTGKTLSRKEMKVLVEVALEKDLFIVSDEVYRVFCYQDEKPVSILEFSEANDRSVMFDSISKSFSACGARIGAIVSKNKELLTRALKYGMMRLAPSMLGQVGAEAAYNMDGTYFEEVRTEYRNRRDTIVEGLQKLDGVSCFVPNGAFYLIAKLPVDNAEEFAKFMLTDFDVDGETVMVAPAEGFYATPGLGRDEIRIAYVLECDKLKRSAEILGKGLKAYKNRR